MSSIFQFALMLTVAVNIFASRLPDSPDSINRNDNDETKQDSGQDAGAPLGDDDFANGEDVAYIASGMKDAIEKGTEYEGEHMSGDLESGRAATTEPSHLWPRGANGNPTVPYTISSSFTASDRATIAKGFEIIERLTCLSIIPRTSENDYISIVDGTGCWAKLGRKGGKQDFSLDRSNNCVWIGTVLHEFAHALGMYHEQSRSDRDWYVKVNWDNIQEWQKYNFKKCEDCSTQNDPYDYNSLLHYDKTLFSNGNGPTMEKIGCPDCALGQNFGLSPQDVKALNMLYSCPGNTRTCQVYDTSVENKPHSLCYNKNQWKVPYVKTLVECQIWCYNDAKCARADYYPGACYTYTTEKTATCAYWWYANGPNYVTCSDY